MEAMPRFLSWLVPTDSRLGVLICTLSVWRCSDLCWQNCSCVPAGWGFRRAARGQTHHPDRQTFCSYSLWRFFYPDGLSWVFSSALRVHRASLEASTSAQEMPAVLSELWVGLPVYLLRTDMCNPCLV